jgi:SAM-dependent methyltransferase
MSCPLCNHTESIPSWIGETVYRERRFPYLECVSCQSLYCEPMPDEETLSFMYGTDYHEADDYRETADENSKRPPKVIKLLKKLEKGVFVDYGCGKGVLLSSAKRLGWQTFGVEFAPDVAARIERETSIKVFCAGNQPEEFRADVLHLGDVIEHLTDLDSQMPEILRWLKPGGWLVAQGPLEANKSLFTFALKNARRLMKNQTSDIPPFHVILATSKGQRQFFKRFGLKETEYSVHEIDFPIPEVLSSAVLKSPRLLALFSLRKISKVGSAVLPGEWGNRYFYCGQWMGEK